jgi:hypothetical protein
MVDVEYSIAIASQLSWCHAYDSMLYNNIKKIFLTYTYVPYFMKIVNDQKFIFKNRLASSVTTQPALIFYCRILISWI